MIYSVPGDTLRTSVVTASGLTGTIGYRIVQGGVTITVRTTSGITEFPASSGVYEAVITAPSTAGQYTIVWDDGAATPTHISAQELTVLTTAPDIIPGPSSGDYITQAELKAARELSGYSFADGEIPTVITTASRVVDHFCGRRRRFWLDDDDDHVRYYTADRCGTVEIDDVAVIAEVATDNNGDGTFELTWATTDYIADPLNAAEDTRAFERLYVSPTGRYRFPPYRRGVRVTGQFGWPAVPSEVVTATYILATRYLLRAREAPAGIIAVGGIEGQIMRLARTDPDIPGLLNDFFRRRPLL